jgi:hypothetical protein
LGVSLGVGDAGVGGAGVGKSVGVGQILSLHFDNGFLLTQSYSPHGSLGSPTQ